MADQAYRTERDSMGEVRVPAHAKWGAQTHRAVENFPISGMRKERSLIQALAYGVYARDAQQYDVRIKAFRLK